MATALGPFADVAVPTATPEVLFATAETPKATADDWLATALRPTAMASAPVAPELAAVLLPTPVLVEFTFR